MSQAGTDSGTLGAPASSPTWETYYQQASKRRRANGGNHWLREEKRRRRMRERIGIGISAVFVGALTLIFYLVLNRR
jgi:hypothetical protein